MKISKVKHAYWLWYLGRYKCDPNWGSGDTLEHFRAWKAGWRAARIHIK
jgi:hypothetical protein